MIDENRLSSVLSDFARTLGTDFPIQGILDHLTERIVGVLPVTGAGVTLISPGRAPLYVAASDDAALRYEQLQAELGQGPCLHAYRHVKPVTVPDLAADTRFPVFGPAAVAEGMAAVFAFPLRHGQGCLGALDLYRDTVGMLDPPAMAAAQTLADVAAAYLLNAQAREQALEITNRFRDSALHDALTGLPNRVLLQQRLQHAAQRARRSHHAAAVLFIDLDRFKRVNDSYGHAVGDELLVAVARRLASVVRPGDTLARVSGDEFVFLCEDLANADDVERLAVRIEEAFRPFAVSGTEIVISASVGIAYSGPGEDVTGQMVVDADGAMYQAKRQGGGRHQVIDLRAAQEGRERTSLEEHFRTALADGMLDLTYQPIVRASDGLITGVEALLRWQHPDRGAIPALTVVSIAEQTGLIGGLGSWVLERSCTDRAQWLTTHPDRPLDMSVNVSANQLMGLGFCRTVASVLDKTGMDPYALILELTEGVFLEDSSRSMSVLADLKAIGVRLALDDFGTGYCSLGYLRRFPVDVVKIDQAFVADIGRHPSGAAIVGAVTRLAHALGMAATAEGVETEQQRVGVASAGCDSAQGYLYARPMTMAALSAELVISGGSPLHLPDARPGRFEAAYS